MLSQEEQFELLAAEARRLGGLGLMSCTGGNVSSRLESLPDRIAISSSGLDKNQLCNTDFVILDMTGRPMESDGRKPSDETALHLAIYETIGCRAVCHGHAPHAVALSFGSGSDIIFEGIEMQKAFQGIRSHAERISLPILENSQDMTELAGEAAKRLEKRPRGVPAILVRGHGVFAWGDSVGEAGRHLETVEWLCRLLVIARQAGIAIGSGKQ